jgi:hypothetical protein
MRIAVYFLIPGEWVRSWGASLTACRTRRDESIEVFMV